MTKYNEVFPSSSPTFHNIYTAYKGELIGLINILHSSKKSEYLSRISNFSSFKKTVEKKYYKKNISKLLKKSSIISIWEQSEILNEALFTAHLAICCELFEGVKISLFDLQYENIGYFLDKTLGKYKQLEDGAAELNYLNNKLHSADAFRTIQILRALGLYTRDSKDVTQLSLGVGAGGKDLTSVHLEPELKILSNNIIEFHVNHLNAKDVILVDGDPQRKEAFEELSRNQSYPIIAINNDTTETLLITPDIMKSRNLDPRNTVIALRIDHRMIPDVKEFLRLVANNIDNVADLIVTIGSGFNIDDFKGRTLALQNMYDFLKSLGLHPVLLKLHGKGTLEEQWDDHAFGLKNITTYQILYCKLKKNILNKIK